MSVTFYYHDERRADDPHYLPSVEVFWQDYAPKGGGEEETEPGFYYWFCMPGCLPDGEAYGPFDSVDAALEHARLDLEDDIPCPGE